MPDAKALSGRLDDANDVLVTGATGRQGGGLARLLLQRGHHVRALTRKPDGAAAGALKAAGAEVVAGDLGDAASLERAAKGSDVMFLVSTPFEQGAAAEQRFGTTAVDAARAAGVPYVVYSSVSDANRRTGIPHFDSKFQVEEHLQASGLDYAIVAPVAFTENLTAPWTVGSLAQGAYPTGVLPDRKLHMISVAEIAEFTALAVERRSSFRGTRTNIASYELTPVETAQQLSDAIGRRITYSPVPIEELRKQNAEMARMTEWFNQVGYSVDIPRLRREHPEVRWRTFREWAAAQNWSTLLPKQPKT